MTDLKSAPAIGSMLIYKPTGELFKVGFDLLEF